MRRIDFSWREWALGIGFVWGTYCLQVWIKVGPLHVLLSRGKRGVNQ